MRMNALVANKKYAAGLGVLLVLGCGAYIYYRATQFAKSYDAYAARAAVHGNAALIPAVKDNPLRKELNQTLGRALSDTSISNTERLALAQRGLSMLDSMELQIDAIGEAGESMEGAIMRMEAYALWATRADIVAAARERFGIIADIRGLSYRANFHTAEIFKRIIKDEGKLTDAHVRELNDQIPVVEQEFDRRTNLYRDLESANARIEKLQGELSQFY